MDLIVIHTHPIQYQVPLYRMLHEQPDVVLRAVFFSDHSVTGGHDKGFGQAVKWDVPILEGYEYRFERNDGPGNPASGFNSYRCSRFREILGALKADAILLPGHGFKIYWQALFAARALKIPVMVRPESLDGAQPRRSPWKALIRKILLKQFYGRIDAFCATGHFSRKDAEGFGIAADAIFDSPYCIDTQLFETRFAAAQSQREAVRGELGVAPGQLVVVFMAKFIDWKNPSLILDALETLNPEQRSKIFPLLVGSGPDFDRVSVRAKHLTGNDRCCPGFVNQSELARYYAAADCAVLPSKRGHESWGLVVNEAMTCGLPVAVSDGVGCRVDLVTPGETGAVFEDGDARELGRILYDWQQNPKTLTTLGEKARARIQNYSSHRAVDGILAAFRALARST